MTKKTDHEQINTDDMQRTVSDLQQTIIDQQSVIEDLTNNWKRALADYKNFEKRVNEERVSLMSYANSVLIMKLLPVKDNLELTVKHFADPSLKMIIKQLDQVLAEEDVIEIDAFGKEFDALNMEAIEMVSGEKNQVVEILTKGYLHKGKLLRPAGVKVGNGELNSDNKN